MLVAEGEEKKRERERALSESCTPLKLSGLSVQELQVSPCDSLNCDNLIIAVLDDFNRYFSFFFLCFAGPLQRVTSKD